MSDSTHEQDSLMITAAVVGAEVTRRRLHGTG